MLLFNANFKDKKGICLKTRKMEAIVLPDEGGKMVSLKATKNWEELLSQAPGDKYLSLTPEGSYIESECSAFDDMFPTIDPWHNGSRMYEDHGEVCRRPHKVRIIEGEDVKVELSVESDAGDYIFTKTYYEKDGGIQIDYSATNLTDKPLPVLWAAHLMLAANEGTSVMLSNPDNGKYEATCMFWDGTNGADDISPVKKGEVFTLDRQSSYLKSGKADKNGATYKFYINSKYSDSVKYGSVILKSENAPYVGIWMNNGVFKEMHNVALELCTAGYDTPGNAKMQGHDVDIAPGDVKRWSLFIDVE